ncbi:MAG: cytidine deaminase [Lachnospiraceae bacterium]|nr:cytidine deaminase [Lachnospiraceae bacterium]
MQDQDLIKLAYQARQRAYAPYSRFSVGAALETEDGAIFQGCNIENATYTPTICAERTAFFKAVSEGYRHFRQIAIVGGYAKGSDGDAAGMDPATVEMETENFAPPCGVCRQVMAEFCDPATFRILLAKSLEDYQAYTLEELLPLNFGPKDL